MSNLVFPATHGIAWEMKKAIVSGTVIQSAWALGHETRISRGPDPLTRFTLQYKILDDGLAHDSLNTLEAFWRSRAGAFDSFLLSINDVTKTTHSTVTGQTLTADGSGNAPFVRAIGGSGSVETVFEMAGVNGNSGSAPVVKLSGSPLTSPADYTIQGPGVALSGTSYPGLVAVITHSITGPVTADFTWYYRVRFEADEQELDMFLYQLWEAQEVKLIEVRA